MSSTSQPAGGVATSDPGMRFWLRYVQAEGALVEDQGDQVLVLLPTALQDRSGLAEVVMVTADPEVSREDGALLLAPGHPLLDSAAADVMDGGDGGMQWLAWPATTRPPTTAVLAERARECVAVEHGRLDRDGEAASVYAPVLRVGGLVTTAASLDLRFQERNEVWVDGGTGLELPPDARRVLAGWSRVEGPEVRCRALTPDLPRALSRAHSLLEQRAAERAKVLAQQVAEACTDALAQVDAYYDAALAAIDRRRRGADEERRGLLEDQAEATRVERTRRRREVEDSFRASHELRPFRLHLVAVPAFRLPVLVRRGASTYPLELTWLLPVGEFAPVACPLCGGSAPLVAGRQRLGCEACLPRPATVPPAALPPAARPSREPRPRQPDSGSPATRVEHRPARPHARRPSRRVEGQPATPDTLRPSPATSTPPSASRVCDVGDQLGLRFWREVAEERRWHRRRTADGSPLRAAHRLYGGDAPLVVAGVPPRKWPSSVRVLATIPGSGLLHQTVGQLIVGHETYPFTLCWELRPDRPVLVEVLPSAHPHGVALPSRHRLATGVADRLFGPAPTPPGLDPVAAALWSVERPIGGLPLVLRCLTAWWRAGDTVPADTDPNVVAASIASLVASRSGIRRSRTEAAVDHRVDPAAVGALARTLQRALELSSERPW